MVTSPDKKLTNSNDSLFSLGKKENYKLHDTNVILSQSQAVNDSNTQRNQNIVVRISST